MYAMLKCTNNTTNIFEFSARLCAKKKAGRIPVIAEIKAHTPRSGDLLKGRTIAFIADCYHTGGAACLSVVTGKWFGGSNTMLKELSQHSSLPILRKDFITNRRQIEQSKSDGAAAVLLTKKLLTNEHLSNLIAFALSIGVTPFVEVSDPNEVCGLQLPEATIIAANNKRIQDKETDSGNIDISLELLDACRATGAQIVVSASGIRTPAQVRRLFNAGFDAFLIGTALLESSDLQNSLKQFCFIQEKAVLP
jgi:indole-3-glycerol phosphate synthase